MLRALQAIFQPGGRRFEDRRRGEKGLIRGIQTMRSMVADVYQFARFVRREWPEVHELEEVTPAMAQAFIAELVSREDSGGRIGRVSASLRKLDAGCRRLGVFSANASPLLPYASQGGTSGYHSDPRPIAYSEDEAAKIIAFVREKDPRVARLLELMWIAGLRVTEAAYLRGCDIHPEGASITLEGGVNHSKGGRPRKVTLPAGQEAYLAGLKALAEGRADGHVFASRRSLPSRARGYVRTACIALEIRPLGTHALRKAFATREFWREIGEGEEEKDALLDVARQLGHNRSSVVRQSYVDPKGLGGGRTDPSA
jgi:integrase